MNEKTEYIIVKDENGTPIGKRKITSKRPMENVHGLLVNESIVIPYGQFDKDQELAKNLPEME